VHKEEVRLSKLRASFLQKKLSQGRIDPDARTLGLEFFDTLKRNGAADAYTFSILLKHVNAAHLEAGYAVSAEMQRVLEEDMPAAGVAPTLAHFNLLVSQLVREGQRDAARRVADVEMAAHGLSADATTARALSLQPRRSGPRHQTDTKEVSGAAPRRGGSAAERKAWAEREVEALITWI
jgi:hypothetical protein